VSRQLLGVESIDGGAAAATSAAHGRCAASVANTPRPAVILREQTTTPGHGCGLRRGVRRRCLLNDQGCDLLRHTCRLRIRRLGVRGPSGAPGQEAVGLRKRRSTASCCSSSVDLLCSKSDRLFRKGPGRSAPVCAAARRSVWILAGSRPGRMPFDEAPRASDWSPKPGSQRRSSPCRCGSCRAVPRWVDRLPRSHRPRPQRPGQIARHWPDILRVIASIHTRETSAHDAIRVLQTRRTPQRAR
jgi:hypothetical protein